MAIAAPSRPVQALKTRLQSVDAVRGAVMIIMALDHVRDFFHAGAGQFRPDDLTRTTAALFFTRWITHFCAPVFMFYAGTAAFLWARSKDTGTISRYLATRGLWLVVLDFTASRFAMLFNFDYSLVILNVLWALGWSMIVLALLVYLPLRAIAAIGIGLIVVHNLFDTVQAAAFGQAAWIWNFLHQPGLIKVGGMQVLFGYPLIPWVGVMAVGYALGGVFTLDAAVRRRVLIRTGLILTGGFILIRAINVYGDPAPWSHQQSALFTVLSFLRVSKYPPSLEFLLMTFGPALLLTGLIDSIRFKERNPLLVFGRTPLFYFVAHLVVAHLLAALLDLMRFGRTFLFFNPPPAISGRPVPEHYGYDLWVTYAAWLTVVVLLYPLCLKFGEWKRQRRDWWASYL